MNKPRRKSAKSRISSSRSVISNYEQSGNDSDAVGIITRDLAVVPPSDISPVKWREIIRDEEQDFIVNSIREEIIASAMDVMYDRYLRRTSHAFVVHCSHRAWLQFCQFINMKHDSGENVQTIAENWSHDEAPDPVPPDPWACRRMTVNKEQQFPRAESERSEPCSSASVRSEKINVEPKISAPSFTPPIIVPESSHQLSTTEMSAEKEDNGNSEAEIITENSSSSGSLGSSDQRQRSIFTRTISMAKADLPVPKCQPRQRSKRSVTTKQKSFLTSPEAAVQSPEPLDLQTLPADRLDIKCVIVPAEHNVKSDNQKSRKTTRPVIKK